MQSRGYRAKVEQEQEVRDAFAMLDLSGSGALDYDGVKAAMRALGFQVKKADVLKAMQKHGASKYDSIDFDTFANLMSEVYAQQEPLETMLGAFRLFDQQSQGHISCRDLQAIASKLGENISDSEAQAMIDQFDKNKDGVIDEREFINVMRMTAPRARLAVSP
jgi:centrin-3